MIIVKKEQKEPTITEFICENEECRHSFVDVKIIVNCRCPKCGSTTEFIDWLGY